MNAAHHAADDLNMVPPGEIQVLAPAEAPYALDDCSPPMPIAAAPRQVATITLNPEFARLLSNRLVVVGILAIVGPLGLPALWLSPRFTRISKILTTAIFLLVTVVLPLAIAYYWLEIAMRPLVDAFGQVHGQ